MILHQYLHTDPIAISYLFGCAGHAAGAVVDPVGDRKPGSTIGFEKRHNKAFRIGDEGAFLRLMLSDVPPAPPRAAEMRAINAGIASAA